MKHEIKSLPPSIAREVRRLETEFLTDLIAVFDADGKYLYASSRQEKLLGYRADELMGGMGWRDVVAPADQKHMDLTWSDAELTGKSIDVSFTVVTRAGDDIKVHGNSRQVVGDDKTRYWVSRVWRE